MRIFPLLAILFLLSCHAALAEEAVPATAYFPVLPFDAPDGVLPQWIPLAVNHPLNESHAGILRAIIVIHDETRDANAALATLAALAGNMNAAVMIVAPQFLLPSDVVGFADHLPDKGHDFAAWQISGWAAGDDSMPVPARPSVSSFTAIDLLLMYLSDRSIFPDLREIVVAGFGAGANFTQRYAALSRAADKVAQQNIDLRFVVAAASSYLYQTPVRPLGGRKGFGRPNAAACPDYDAYPFGLQKLNTYARRVGSNAVKTDYALRFITYLNAGAENATAETVCAVALQGKNRAERADSYRLYLQSLYGDVAAKTQTFSIAKDAKNSPTSLFGSTCGMAVLFGDGNCASPLGDVQ
ncbi:MAG: hypothetical protein P4M13_11770 [Alphaproteobacteria bacterium]|nr:hypothetical protein [Alphaproteobacteria bacterium]